MRIAQVAPLSESVPPKLYGGTERVVSYLTEELVRLGHDVTLFASGDSVTAARLESICNQALRLNKGISQHDAPMMMQLLMEQALENGGDFDIIHSHLDHLGFPLARRNPTPMVPHSMVGSICQNCSRYFASMRRCRWSRFRMRNGHRSPGPIGKIPSIMVYQRIYTACS